MIIRVAYFVIINLLLAVQVSGGLNLGLISNDLKKISNPFIIKKTSHHSPITINIKREIFKPQKLVPPNLPPLLPLKTHLIKTKIKKTLKSPVKLPKLLKVPTLSPLPKLSKLPKLPLLPLIPPLLVLPKIPKLPLLPLPLLPLIPPLPPPIMPLMKLKKPISVPILGKTKLQSTELRPLKLPSPKTKVKKKILENLRKLKKDGSLTTSQFMRFKKKFEL